ncbi:MAG TPA: hypothetical protein VFO39_12115 [Candidatus Sulfotelmatobacter sp.]|nr:hypothetical protein [Candidatus Sulfotelmatobacter sp.]
MYVLQLDEAERRYLLSFLRGRRGTAARLKEQLSSSEDCFGTVTWSDADIATELQNQGMPETAGNIRAIRTSYLGQHIDDEMIDSGWAVLEQAVTDLKNHQ